MNVTIRGDDSGVRFESPPMTEIERLPIYVTNTSTGLLDDKQSCRMVPNLFDVVGSGRESHVDLRIPTGYNRVLGLTVEANGIFRDAQHLCHVRSISVRAMTGLD